MVRSLRQRACHTHTLSACRRLPSIPHRRRRFYSPISNNLSSYNSQNGKIILAAKRGNRKFMESDTGKRKQNAGGKMNAVLRSKSFRSDARARAPSEPKDAPTEADSANVIFNEYLRCRECDSVEDRNRRSNSFAENNSATNGQRRRSTGK